ncbi:MAG: 4-(cytidine 5'-diphospho)-2-C-methyl-D-erythritol kinase [Chloroflexi bacterium CG07_land_8_20_14_0_80_51_10]|nr:MAG: 4-(cytidine 5'-diphospho)-2-C-methyl-D-erythritol kinase [Chloroflexi bacterium CG07_land_8_20_14_0_80_51_10]
MLTLPAYAKVNLTLEVLARRDDGYHEIASVLQTISLSDELSFEPADGIKFVCHDPSLGKVRYLKEAVLNIVGLLQAETGCRKGTLIRLIRASIPRSAGLGSSSSVPAAVLKGLNELWSLGLPLGELSRLASRIGSDTPFFIYGGTALAEGRGERITPLYLQSPISNLQSPICSLPRTWLVLLKPPIDPVPDKTARMYAMLDSSRFTTGASTQRLVGELQQGHPLRFEMLCNTFERVVFDFFPQLGEYRQRFLDTGATSVHLAGAGPTLFTLVSSKTQGEALASRLNNEGLEAYLVRTV